MMNEQGSIDHNAIAAARLAQIRQRLIESKHCRQKAVALFPLQTARMAETLRQMLDVQDMGGSTKTIDEVADDMETRIRQCYRDLFGEELPGLTASEAGNP